MNKHFAPPDFEFHGATFSSDVIRVENRKKTSRERLLTGVTGCMLALGASYLAYAALASLREAMAHHVHYVQVVDPPFVTSALAANGKAASGSFMPGTVIGMNPDVIAARARIQRVQAESQSAMMRFRIQQDAFAKSFATGGAGAVLFSDGTHDGPNSLTEFAPATAGDFQP